MHREWERLERLLNTIDKTINHLQGKEMMKAQEMFDGFTVGVVKRAKEDQSYFVAEALVLASVKNGELKKNDPTYQDELVKKAHELFKQIVDCMKNCTPSSKEVQSIIQKHHAFIQEHHDATKQVYKALAQLYREHPAFRKQLDPFHPHLAEFLATSMEAFADKSL